MTKITTVIATAFAKITRVAKSSQACDHWTDYLHTPSK